jgi:MOSC domain-containing protein YiiM
MSGRFDRLPVVGHRSDASPVIGLDGAGACRHDGLVHVEEINIGLSEALKPVASAPAVAGKGLRGDRHFDEDGAKPGQALTLIEAEALEDVGLTGAQSRRQVVVRGVRLNELVGRRFRVGDVEFVGVELCDHLQQLTRPGIIKDLIHRGGLNADVLTDGQIRVGDPVRRVDRAAPVMSAHRPDQLLTRARSRRHDSAFGGDADHYQPPCQAACRHHMCEAVDMVVPGGGLHD